MHTKLTNFSEPKQSNIRRLLEPQTPSRLDGNSVKDCVVI